MLLIVLPVISYAQEMEVAPDNSFGGWHFVNVHHDFQKPSLYLNAYIEHANFQYQRLDCFYGRFTFGCKPLKWLSFGASYLPVYQTSGLTHHMEAEVVGTLKSGDLAVSIRERYRHCFNSHSNELRSRLKVTYYIPNSNFVPYLAAEVFTWGNSWYKTRHYVSCAYNFTQCIQLEWYYMYYAFNGSPARNILGLGLNFTI